MKYFRLQRRTGTLLVVITILLTAAGCGSGSPAATPTPEQISIIQPAIQLTSFALQDQNNKRVHLSDFRGKVVLLAFGYTHCPDVCPVTLARFKQVKTLLGSEAEKIAFIFISVDGKRDTPERLHEYLPVFDPSFIGLTGDDATVRQVIAEFGGTYVLNDGGGLRIEYTVDHTAAAFGLDTEGKVVRKYAYGTASEEISADLLAMLSATAGA